MGRPESLDAFEQEPTEVYCSCCGRQMCRGEIEQYDLESGEPYYRWHCPEYVAFRESIRGKWWVSKSSPHYSYSEWLEQDFNHETGNSDQWGYG